MTRTIFHIASNEYLSRVDYAKAYAVGTLSLARCSTCGKILDKLVRPLVLEWEPKECPQRGYPIPDFSWQNGVIVVTQQVRDGCETAAIQGVAFSEVVVKPLKKLPKKLAPITVPPLFFFEITTTLRLDMEQSGRKIASECPECHWIDYESIQDVPLAVMADGNNDLEVFHVHGVGVPFCSERFQKLLLQHEFSNIAVKERGILI